MAGIEDVQRAINAEMSREGWTRAQFAKRVQLDPGTLADLLDGRRTPKAPTQGKIERYFGWEPGTIAELLAGRGAIPRPASPSSAGRVDIDTLSPLEAEALVSAFERELESTLAQWANARVELDRIARTVSELEETRDELAEKIEILRTRHLGERADDFGLAARAGEPAHAPDVNTGEESQDAGGDDPA